MNSNYSGKAEQSSCIQIGEHAINKESLVSNQIFDCLNYQ